MATDLLSPTGADLRPEMLHASQVPGLYVHIPFCAHKCHYCDFYSITRQSTDRMTRFVDLLLLEAKLWMDGGRNGGPTIRPATVFFGGGTPTLLPPAQMQRLLNELRQRFDCTGVHEWTVEANPATVDAAYCELLHANGVDRISFGAQSFNRADLAMLERHHNPDDVPRSIELARTAGFARINADLIYAIPGQDLQSWSSTLETTLGLGLRHMSCYGLTYEPNTAMTVRKRLGQFTAAAESLELSMLHHTRRRLTEAGLPPYEISNFAAPGQACRHNLHYWNGGNYIGLGPSAASHVDGSRFRNRPHLGEWERAIEAGRLPATDVERLSPRRRAGELVMLMLRLPGGIAFRRFTDATGEDARRLFGATLGRLAVMGLLEVDTAGFRLTEKAIDVADAVAAEFLE